MDGPFDVAQPSNGSDEIPFTLLCRVCGQTHENLVPIFEGEGSENNLAEKIHSYLPIKVDVEDGLPLQLCYQCASALLAWHNFIQNCIDTNIALNSRLSKSQPSDTSTKVTECSDSTLDVSDSSKKRSAHCPSFRAYHQAQTALHHPFQYMVTSPFDGDASVTHNQCTVLSNSNISLYQAGVDCIGNEKPSTSIIKKCVINDISKNNIQYSTNLNDIGGQDRDNFPKGTFENDSVYRERYQMLQDMILKLESHIKSHHEALIKNEDEEENKPLSRLLSPNSVDSDKSIGSDYETDVKDGAQYPCTRCTYVAVDKDELEKHTQNNHNYSHNLFKRSSRRIYDLQTRQELEKAKVKIEGKVNYRCNICNRYLTSAYSFVSHRTIHSGQKLFACQICGRKFRLLGFLKNHLKHIHSMKGKRDLYEFQNSCTKTQSNDSSNSEQTKKERNYVDYKAIEKVKIVINGGIFYQCEICDKKLTRVNYYLSHMTIHTGEKKFICHLCGKRFRLGTMLQIHLRLTHERIKNYTCDICHQKFGTSTNLSEHRRIHTGERPHICAKCGKRFKQKSALFVHNRTHTDYFPFKCNHCDSKFRIQSQLNYHMIKHTGERPFSCEVCGKAFAIKSHLNRHTKNHVEGRPFPCTECTKDFRHKKNLKSHLKNCHKL